MVKGYFARHAFVCEGVADMGSAQNSHLRGKKSALSHCTASVRSPREAHDGLDGEKAFRTDHGPRSRREGPAQGKERGREIGLASIRHFPL